ncbi:hypothetical protein QAD02_009147 [Eretmocerus hayati]|uniref:Uncharacterized protein n=1 Tax=Eretmocerus hayati TaxID=131215 RepID=A0ACC2N8V9_9HYME|nr:hypothetical protein QAD02_009147 [Eretmocerus hayati]
MKELQETNCEIRNIVNLKLPQWIISENTDQEEHGTSDGSKELNPLQRFGGFLDCNCQYAWLTHETRLVVIECASGKYISNWNFSSKVTSVSPFPVRRGVVPLILVGLDNNAIRIKDSVGHLCVFDPCASIILTTIEVPAGVEKACVIHGGEEWEEYEDQRPETVLEGNTGLIFCALRNLQHIIIDLNKPLWENLYLEGQTITARLDFVNSTHAVATPSKRKKEPLHLAYNLMDYEIEQYIGFDRQEFEATPLYDENLCSVLLSSTKIGCLITGCLGRVIIWQMDGSIGWISPLFDENAYVTHVALIEPSDDPRPFYYLWIACQSDAPDSSAVLRMYALFFNKKYCDRSGESSLYYNLESEPSLKFELELDQGERVHSLLAVERDSSDCNSRHGEDSLLLIGTDERLLLFDLNRWYKEQMPRTISECRNPNSVMASYRTRQEDDSPRSSVLACVYKPRSLKEFPNKNPSSPEELFYPNSLKLEWLEMTHDCLTSWLARGVQAELLREITIAGPIVLIKPTETYRRCLSSGLVPFDSVPQDFTSELEQSKQREMLLSLCLEQGWSSFLSRCAQEWSDGSFALLYPEFLRWGVERASEIKLIADELCVPLFDQSGTSLGETELRTLRFCTQQLECLTAVVSKLPNLQADLERQRRALRRISNYLQVLLWFYEVGLLPELHDVEEQNSVPQITMRIPYPLEKLLNEYKLKRDRIDDPQTDRVDRFFIDFLLALELQPVQMQWKDEAGSEIPKPSGHYPPPSLQSLLRIFLLDCYLEDRDNSDDVRERGRSEIDFKHCVIIYLFMDLAWLLQNTHPNIDRLIQYPSAFSLSSSLIKLTQAFWFLDHDDYEEFFNIITSELVCSNDIKSWHHKLAMNTLLRNNQYKLALKYMRIMKPPLSSMEDQAIMIDLTVKQGLVEHAFQMRPPSHYSELLTKFFLACKESGKLMTILSLSLDHEEEEAFVKFLKEQGCEDTRLLYYLQRSRHIEANTIFKDENDIQTNTRYSNAPKLNPRSLKIMNLFNKTLPDVTKRFIAISNQNPQLPSKSQGYGESQGYPRPMSQCRSAPNGIYELSVEKARETCVKVDRAPGATNHLPFIVPPCSTIVHCTRFGNNHTTEHSDAINVTFPKRSNLRGKRTQSMRNGSENCDDGEVEKKKRKLLGEPSSEHSPDDEDLQNFRRLSMSQVCLTPLIQRRIPSDDAVATPQSILKIREMIKRNSGSPGYNLSSSFSNNKDTRKKTKAAGDGRTTRQIRFSMDRFSGNGSSNCSGDGSNHDGDEQACNASVSSKNTAEDSNIDEAYYSPNLSIRSIREDSILSDNSFTQLVGKPRPRPGLQRSSIFSRSSSEYLSQRSDSSNNTLDTSTQDESLSRRANASSRKSFLSGTIYSASILSPNTSVECTPLKRFLTVNAEVHEEVENSEDSQDSTEIHEKTYQQFERSQSSENFEDENETVNYHEKTYQQFERSQSSDDVEDEKETANSHEEWPEEPMEVDFENEVFQDEIGENLETSAKSKHDISHEHEISEDEEVETEAFDGARKILSHVSAEEEEEDDEASEKKFERGDDPIEEEDDVATERKFERGDDPIEEEDEQDEAFESLNNSIEDASEQTGNCLRLLENYENSRPSHRLTADLQSSMQKVDHDNSILDNIEQYEDQQRSLTQPMFIDAHGIVKFGDPADITDDESRDGVEKPDLETEEPDEEETNLTLNLSTSDEDKAKESNLMKINGANVTESLLEEEQKLEREATSLLSDPVEESNSDLANKNRLSDTQKESSIESRLSSLSNKNSSISYRDTPQRSSVRNNSSSIIKGPTPRRPIKSMSSSPRDETLVKGDLSDFKDKRSLLVTEEMKRVSSPVVLEPLISDLVSLDKSILVQNESLLVEGTENNSKIQGYLHTSVKSISHDHSLVAEMITTERKSIVSESILVDKCEISELPGAISSCQDGNIVEECNVRIEKISDDIVRKSVRTKAVDLVTPVEDASVKSSSNESLKNAKDDSKIPSESRSTRASSQAKETSVNNSVSTRKTKAASVIIEEQPAEDQDQARPDESIKSRSARAPSSSKDTSNAIPSKAKKSRANSVSKSEDLSDSVVPVRRTRAASVSQTETSQQEVPVARRTRAGSVSVVESSRNDESLPVRRTRAGSVASEVGVSRKTRASSQAKDSSIIDKSTKRSTRASSQAKETSSLEESSTRSTRASSLAKETNTAELDETAEKKSSRKRGNSIPKEIAPFEPPKLQTRGRRSTSLLKEVIPEETSSQMESTPGHSSTRRRSLLASELSAVAMSSPAANTRLRRSSIHSVPEELEPILSPPKTVSKKKVEVKEESRPRRAASVDSSLLAATLASGKRITRSVLAKTSIVDEVIPEEATPLKRPPARRKHTSSVTENKKDEDKKPASKAKKGRKQSESKSDDIASAEPGEVDGPTESTEKRTPTKPSKSAARKKCISPIPSDDESLNGKSSDDETTDILKRIQNNSKRTTLRRQRTTFVLPKRKNKEKIHK